MGRLRAWGRWGCTIAPFLAAFLLLKCIKGDNPLRKDSYQPSDRLPAGQQLQGHFHGASSGAHGQRVHFENPALPALPVGTTSVLQSSSPAGAAGSVVAGSMPLVGGATTLSGSAVSMEGASAPSSGTSLIPTGATDGWTSAPEPSHSLLGGITFNTRLTPLISGSIPSSGTIENLPSRAALAAMLPVPLQGTDEKVNTAPVLDTRTPVGFNTSSTGTYEVPRFPSAIKAIGDPSEEMIRKCMVRISASKMTNGFSDTLKYGTVHVYGNAQQQLLRVVATSSPRYTSKVTAPYVLLQRISGARLRYEVKVDVPSGCVLLPADPNLKALVRREGSYTIDAKVRLTPDVLVTHLPSIAPVPSDILMFAAKLPRNSNFRPVGHCVFVAHFTASHENIRLAASQASVQVTVLSVAGSEVLGMQIPLPCLPQSPHRIAMWAAPVGTGTAVIVGFSPPPAPERPWFTIPATVDPATFYSTSAPAM